MHSPACACHLPSPPQVPFEVEAAGSDAAGELSALALVKTK